jgi:hypothetical protein
LDFSMTAPVIPLGRQNEDLLVAAIQDVQRLVVELKEALPNVNNRVLRPQAIALFATAEAVVVNHSPEPKPAIADDLSGLMSGLLAFRIPSRDSELGRTPTLTLLRQIKGLMLAAVNDALEAAARIGIHARRSSLKKQFAAEISLGCSHQKTIRC